MDSSSAVMARTAAGGPEPQLLVADVPDALVTGCFVAETQAAVCTLAPAATEPAGASEAEAAEATDETGHLRAPPLPEAAAPCFDDDDDAAPQRGTVGLMPPDNLCAHAGIGLLETARGRGGSFSSS